MSDRESIEHDAMVDGLICQQEYEKASKESALDQCIYLFVEGESEETAFRILLEEGLGIKFEEYGIVIANYNGIGNLKNTARLMNKTLSHKRPMVFTFDDDDKNKVPKLENAPINAHFFKIPQEPVVTLANGDKGGSFEESFPARDFIDACFETSLLRSYSSINKSDFESCFVESKPFYAQMVKFLQRSGCTNYTPSKIEIAEWLAVSCEKIPRTYTALAALIQKIRAAQPVQVKM